jgi:hypothetical protein
VRSFQAKGLFYFLLSIDRMQNLLFFKPLSCSSKISFLGSFFLRLSSLVAVCWKYPSELYAKLEQQGFLLLYLAGIAASACSFLKCFIKKFVILHSFFLGLVVSKRFSSPRFSFSYYAIRQFLQLGIYLPGFQTFLGHH